VIEVGFFVSAFIFVPRQIVKPVCIEELFWSSYSCFSPCLPWFATVCSSSSMYIHTSMQLLPEGTRVGMSVNEMIANTVQSLKSWVEAALSRVRPRVPVITEFPRGFAVRRECGTVGAVVED